MKVKQIPVLTAARQWLKDPVFRAEYDAQEEEFSLVSALIAARAKAGLTQTELASRMGTTQAVIARLEGGKTRPSTQTLARYAAATGCKLKISLEPIRRRSAV